MPPDNERPDGRLAQNVEISTLCAFYGGLLTPKQQEALKLHYNEDWSLGEIAEHLGVSRQNVHDLITRSVQKLRHYEAAVGGVAQAQTTSDTLRQVLEGLTLAQESLRQAPKKPPFPRDPQAPTGPQAHLAKAIDQLDQLIILMDGEE